MPLVQAQATGVQIITGAFKAIFAQALNIEAHLMPIDLEPDKKIIQIAACLFSRSFYHTLNQVRSTDLQRTLTLLKTIEKCYVKFDCSNIDELERRQAYILFLSFCSSSINIPSSKKKATQLHNQ